MFDLEPSLRLLPLELPSTLLDGLSAYPWLDDVLVATFLVVTFAVTRIAAGIERRRREVRAASLARQTLATILDIAGPYGATKGRARWNAVTRSLEIRLEFPEGDVVMVGKLGIDPVAAAWGLLAHRPEPAEDDIELQEPATEPVDPALPAGKQWWDILGVRRDAGEGEVALAYRKMARSAHPDAGGTDERMAEINAARDEWRQHKR